MERVLYFESYIVVEPGMCDDLEQGDLLSEAEYEEAKQKYGAESFSALIGAEAIKSLLEDIDLKHEQKTLRAELAKKNLTETKHKKISKRLRVVEQFVASNIKPEWMVMTVVPVIPPDLRPLVPLEGGRFATSDLNDLYRRLINRNNRLKRLIGLRAPDIIIRNEKRILQESVDALFDNGRRGRVFAGTNKRPLKSLSDMLKGKQGRFRQNLLGKRVDYSGRSVIVVGPELNLHQCGLPKKMALELFKPFVYSRLERFGIASTIKSAKKMVEDEDPKIWDILEGVIREHPVLLNRAPTLHRLGIQAFEPQLVEGKAIRLHPLVCTAFNADFDGDQMAVHVPLSIEAQLEARVLMMSTNNILSPAHGKPIIMPTLDIVLGLYHLSLIDPPKDPKPVMAGMWEVMYALEQGKVGNHTQIVTSVKGEPKPVTTTPGRLMIWEVVPKNPKIGFELINQVLTKKEVTNLVDTVYRHCGQKETVIFADRLMELGFGEATRSGISFGTSDLVVPTAKSKLIEDARKQVAEFESQYQSGLITKNEKYNKVVDVWSHCTEKVSDEMLKEMTPKDKTQVEDYNSIYMMAHSGARGSAAQLKQLAGMRGLMAKPSGEIIENPIISNFKEGLTVLEYFNSSHGARKGLADTALKTANSGYLTRRLVDVAQDCIVNEEDCQTKKGLTMAAIVEEGEILETLSERIVGRTAQGDIKLQNKVLVKNGETIDESVARKIEENGILEVKVRSPLTCELSRGICAKCYGRDLARGAVVNKGEAVGIIAAQSIGEPGTQLTMRTFHIGGAVQAGGAASAIVANYGGKVVLKKAKVATNSKGEQIVMDRHAQLIIHEKGVDRAIFRLPFGARLMVAENDTVKAGHRMAEWDPHMIPIISEKGGKVKYEDLIEGVSLKEEMDEATGIASKIIVQWKKQKKADLHPRIALLDSQDKPIKTKDKTEQYFLSVDAILSVDDGQQVKGGDLLGRIPRESSKTRDITGGLPRVAELFEARKPKEHAVISEIAGKVSFEKDYKSKRKIKIEGESESREYLIPKGKHISVQQGDYVEVGDLLMDGYPAPHDILKAQGIEALARYLIKEVQDVYRLQGVKINDKHIEVIIRQMLQKVIITATGDSNWLKDEEVERFMFQDTNKALAKEGKQPAKGDPLLLGITKAALHTDSFISAASFQETTRVLTDAAVAGKTDTLEGLKENVIVGRLIPAGTGSVMRTIAAQAAQKDKILLEKQQLAMEASEAAREATREANRQRSVRSTSTVASTEVATQEAASQSAPPQSAFKETAGEATKGASKEGIPVPKDTAPKTTHKEATPTPKDTAPKATTAPKTTHKEATPKAKATAEKAPKATAEKVATKATSGADASPEKNPEPVSETENPTKDAS